MIWLLSKGSPWLLCRGKTRSWESREEAVRGIQDTGDGDVAQCCGKDVKG